MLTYSHQCKPHLYTLTQWSLNVPWITKFVLHAYNYLFSHHCLESLKGWQQRKYVALLNLSIWLGIAESDLVLDFACWPAILTPLWSSRPNASLMTALSHSWNANGPTSRDSFPILAGTQTPLASNINQKPVANNNLSLSFLITVPDDWSRLGSTKESQIRINLQSSFSHPSQNTHIVHFINWPFTCGRFCKWWVISSFFWPKEQRNTTFVI